MPIFKPPTPRREPSLSDLLFEVNNPRKIAYYIFRPDLTKDEGVEIIGHVDDYDAAVAACALGAFDFVKGS